MKLNRSILLFASGVLVLFLVGGGLAQKVGATEGSYRNAILFAEVLSLVSENYVDPVETAALLDGAYEGLLAGLDTQGAYLTPQEVVEWKAPPAADATDPGLVVLKTGRTLLVVGVDEHSSAADAGIVVGDQLRAVDGLAVVDRSLLQSRRVLLGKSGSRVMLNLLRADQDFKPDEVELIRAPRRGRPHHLDVRQGVAVLRVTDLDRISVQEVATEIGKMQKNGPSEILLDLRNVADGSLRRAAELAGLFTDQARLRLRDRSGKILDSISVESKPLWSGSVAVLVNGATAGGGEALAKLLQLGSAAKVFGEKTFGLGTEPQLLELEDGSGLLVSSGLWETESGENWNAEGIAPDHEVNGEGDTFAELAADQLIRVLDLLEEQRKPKAESEAA